MLRELHCHVAWLVSCVWISSFFENNFFYLSHAVVEESPLWFKVSVCQADHGASAKNCCIFAGGFGKCALRTAAFPDVDSHLVFTRATGLLELDTFCSFW